MDSGDTAGASRADWIGPQDSVEGGIALKQVLARVPHHLK
jgi:hypothetical protein